MLTKSRILAEIRRTAEANAGRALGKRRFETETGIRESDWLGRYWARWSEAVREAGFEPDQLKAPYTEDFILEKLAILVVELGHFPVRAELRLKSRRDPTFPDSKTVARHGSRRVLAVKLLEFCRRRGDPAFAAVVEICDSIASQVHSEPVSSQAPGVSLGSVYLLKSGRHYKIGRSNASGRREYELDIQLPQRAEIIHEIKTDDPAGIERYWHRRFEGKRLRGEWFKLSAEDIAAFKRRRFM